MPERIARAAEASRHVGDVELTPRPTALPNIKRIKESAAAAIAPATTGVHCRNQSCSSKGIISSSSGLATSIVMLMALPQAKEGKYRHDHNDQANQVNQSVHESLLRHRLDR